MPRTSYTKREYNDLFDSRGVIKNYKKAFPVLIFAAKLGHPHAQNLLGYCYDRGLVTKPNSAAAAHWYKLAAQKNHTEAIYNLALCYDHGEGVAATPKKGCGSLQQGRVHGAQMGPMQFRGDVFGRDRDSG